MGKLSSLFLICCILFTGCGDKAEKYLELYNKGKNLFLNNNLKQAEELFKQSIQENKNYIPSYIMLGKTYYYRKQMKNAKEYFHKALDINKHSINALIWLARLEGIDEKKYDLGLKYCDQVLDIDMENYSAHFYKGIILQQQKKIKEAIMEFHNALQIEKLIYLSHLSLGDIYYSKGIKDKALEEYKRVLKYEITDELKNDLEARMK